MKNAANINSTQSKQSTSNKPSAEVRDDLDSRKNEEQDFKGNDLTHNEKDTKSDKTKKET